MPELPEVETVVSQLRPLLRGRSVRRVELLDPLLGRLPVQQLCGRRIGSVLRLGKQIVLGLERGSPGSRATRACEGEAGGSTLWLGVHLRMTGRLIWLPRGAASEPDHVRARVTLDKGRLVFADLRRFGTLALSRDRSVLQPAGVDPTDERFGADQLAELLRGSAQAIKVWLLRQDRLVGLGNIYACEILYEARIDPRCPAGSLRTEEIGRLHRATRGVLRRAIDNCGTTFSDFQDAHGVTGSYQQYLQVYGREDQPCFSCGHAVQRLVQQQRSTFFCPHCQPRTRRRGPASRRSARVLQSRRRKARQR